MIVGFRGFLYGCGQVGWIEVIGWIAKMAELGNTGILAGSDASIFD